MSGTSHERSGPRRTTARAATAVVAAALLAPLLAAGPAATADPRPDDLRDAFARAAERHGVPESVLLGVSYLQSRWDGHNGAASVSGGYGPMHLTDLTAARTSAGKAPGHSEGEDPRGDAARPMSLPRDPAAGPPGAAADGTDKPPERLRTLVAAAELTGLPRAELRRDPAANIMGGAALLAAEQRQLGLPPSDDPADWFGAVAGYSRATDEGTAAVYAGDVFDVIREGASRTTDSGQRVTLRPHEELRAEVSQVRKLGLRAGQRDPELECPKSISCEWIPAPYEQYEGEDGELDYGNHDKSRRPRSQDIDYIVVHDTEERWKKTLDLVQDPKYVSWHYTLRSSDGHVAQHVRTKDTAWHAGNWYVNSKSVGLEHEGFLAEPDAWFTEAMYRSSARLVKHLARKYDIPLDRQHILGHDNVPGTVTSSIPDMHTDPGPYWDWRHYFKLLGEPLRPAGGGESGMVTIRPSYAEHQPVYTKCDDSGDPCPAHGSGAVRLRTEPDPDAPMLADIGLDPSGEPATRGVNDTGARASTGQRYAVAGRDGDWTAVWYLGQRGWFHNPADQPTAVPAAGPVVTPKKGEDSVPVYGRAYPEKDAYPEDVPVQEISPLPYELGAGQEYALGLRTKGEYQYAVSFDPAKHQVVRGDQTYYQIQFGHRVAFVKAEDVNVRRAR
ncbi:N-acetylmuramoyl-L-alanine amidase [Streptomyces oceani]|uniref:N-acetylmuramoyl-L-alanine amidase n=1 Tax=Streptomyces oceani TaxID=1075402 RepID=A0A1E7KGP8_9ACTN|nr:N-acetylmuramoyl-L-alanine amidase [Streptomyces oceani]OEV03014.1 amidase [Streptomyces oceani]